MGLVQDSVVTTAEVAGALRRLLASKQLAGSQRLSQFLSYIVEETLAGRGDQIKGYAIGLEVFDRPDDFDPETDAIVRVQAGRLRSAMQTYYLTEGQDDPVVIDVPKGSYVPVFGKRSPPADIKGEQPRIIQPQPGKWWRRPTSLAFGVLSVAVLAALLAAILDFRDGDNHAVAVAFEDASIVPTGPKIAVLPFESIGTSDQALLSTIGITIQLVSDLTSFKNLFVLAPNATIAIDGTSDAPLSAVRQLGAEYVVTGSLQDYEGGLRVIAQLVELESDQILWSESFDRTTLSVNLVEVLDEISGRIANALGQPYGGVIERLESQQLSRRPERLTSFLCVLRFHEYTAFKTPQKHLEARDCLLDALEVEPNYARAWAALSWIYGDEVRYGFNALPGDATQRAIEAARTAIRIDPSDSFNHGYVAIAYLDRRNEKLFLEHAKRALELNPNDASMLAGMGWGLCLTGNWDAGVPLVEKARELNPTHLPWYRAPLALNHYRLGEYDEALDHATAYYQPDSLLSVIILVASRAQAGSLDQAAPALDVLRSSFADDPAGPRSLLQLWGIPEPLIEQLIQGLRKAGLQMET